MEIDYMPLEVVYNIVYSVGDEMRISLADRAVLVEVIKEVMSIGILIKVEVK